MSNKPATVAVAIYPDKVDADLDYDAVRNTKSAGELDHIAIAVVEKQADGDLKIDRHDSTAKHLAWVVAFWVRPPRSRSPRSASCSSDHSLPTTRSTPVPAVSPGTSGRTSPRTTPAPWATCSRPASSA